MSTPTHVHLTVHKQAHTSSTGMLRVDRLTDQWTWTDTETCRQTHTHRGKEGKEGRDPHPDLKNHSMLPLCWGSSAMLPLLDTRRDQSLTTKESRQNSGFKEGSVSTAFKVLILHRYGVAFWFFVRFTDGTQTCFVTSTDKDHWRELGR